MADMTFNTMAGEVVARKLLILYLNTGTYTEPVWSPIGKRVEDSSMEYDWGEESKTDILRKSSCGVNFRLVRPRRNATEDTSRLNQRTCFKGIH